ncbi:MAG: PA14 domain-containing protein [Verrucomicrobiota bacterium]
MFGGLVSAWAFDGRVEYEKLCGACHAPNGQGAAGGQFPPLAGSEWVQGDAERMIQVILHGMEGPVTVKGREYNLAMPPQGAALKDEQISAIATYVRKAWGNAETAVSLSDVQKARERTKGRSTMWTQEELLQRWPLPEKGGAIGHLVASLYKGKFLSLPDFSTMDPDAVEEEASGVIDVKQAGEKDYFAMVWEGELTLKKDGAYVFFLDSDDGSRVLINGEEVVAVKGQGPMGREAKGRIKLKKGTAKLRVEYFEAKGGEGISLKWKVPGEEYPEFLSETKGPRKTGPPSIPIVVQEEARIYRNFIKGTSARGIGVGYPGGVNLAFSADNLGIDMMWMGKFMDGGLHWSNRGKGFQAPAGSRVAGLGTGPAWASVENPGKWPKVMQPWLKSKFKGYNLDKKKRPAFKYVIGGVRVKDSSKESGSKELVRTLCLMADKEGPKKLMMRLAGPGAKALGSHLFDLGNGVQVELAKSAIAEPLVTPQGVFLKLQVKKGEERIGLRYRWN